MNRRIPEILLQGAEGEFNVLFGLLGLGLIVGWILFIIFVAAWIRKDAKRRGKPPTAWVLVFVGASVVGIIGNVLVLVVWLLTRPDQIQYDDQGHMVVPPTPPVGVPPAPAAWTPVAASVPAPAGAPPPAPRSVPPPAPVPVPFSPPNTPLSRVKCPRCQTIFQFQRAFSGPTHVKCPACGEEGNI